MLEYRYSERGWHAGPPKSKQSYRTIPLTGKAYEVLERRYNASRDRYEAEGLNRTLPYVDRRTGETKQLCMRDLVFVNTRTGMPDKNSAYDTHLYNLCDRSGIKRVGMHALRHTYSTRAIERGVQPKVLQWLLGHSSIQTTMDRYVHVTEDSLFQAVRQFESSDKV